MGGKMYLGNQMVTPVMVDLDLQFENLQGSPYDNAALKDALDAKQDGLVSGTNIKLKVQIYHNRCNHLVT